MWDLSCVDWQDRIRSGRSLIPDLPLFQKEAELGVKFFDALRLPDVPGNPLFRDAAGDWFRDIVRVVFGSRNPDTNERMIREVFAEVPKGQAKTTYTAGMTVVAMLMNLRPRAEGLFIGPKQAISDRAYSQAVGIIECDPELKKRFNCVEHLKEIVDRLNKSKMKVKTFDLNILTGSMPVWVVLDEPHLLARNPHAAKVIRQIRGGLEKNSEGFFMMITTQSDEPPAGAFRDELLTARQIRDGRFKGQSVRAALPILYEFPDDIARDPVKWQDPNNWHMVMPNLGRSMRLESMVRDWETERVKGLKHIAVWASQHLNIEIGVGQKTDGWPGAEFWAQSEDETITLDEIKRRCDMVVVGGDGGGLDDLWGLNVLGRDRDTRDWLSWSHAWCHRGVLDRRQTIAARLLDFEAAGELTIVDDELGDTSAIIAIIEELKDLEILAAVSVDPAGLGEFIEELRAIGLTPEDKQVIGAPQGYAMMNAIKTAERKLVNGTLRHSKSSLMDWCVTNVKIEPTATAIRATKVNAGDAKIDPWAALMNSVTVMVRNPEPTGTNAYESLAKRPSGQPDIAATADADDHHPVDAAILKDPKHPQFEAARQRFNAALAMADEEYL